MLYEETGMSDLPPSPPRLVRSDFNTLPGAGLGPCGTAARKNRAIPTRFLPRRSAKSTEIRTYGVFLFVRGMSVRGMEEGLVWIIPLTIIPLTSLRPCPSPCSFWLRLAAPCSFCILHFAFCISLESVVQFFLVAAGRVAALPPPKQGLQKNSKKSVDKY